MDHLSGIVLVIGGTGFLGSHIADMFAAQDRFRVAAISRTPTKNENPSVKCIIGDVTKHRDMATIVQRIKPTIIVHAITPGPFAPAHMHYQDFDALRNLVLVSCKTNEVKAFIYSGSVEAIASASGARKTPLLESEALLHTPKTASSPYALCKSISEDFVLKANGPSLATLVLRLPGIYGPRDRGISPGLLKMADSGISRIQFGNNEIVHDWVYVESAAYAHVLAAAALLDASRTSQRRVDGETFFITDGAPMKFWDFARSFWALAGRKDKTIIVVPWWVVLALALASEVLCRIFTLGRKAPTFSRSHVHYMKEGGYFDIQKARERLGYSPLVHTNEGIQKTVTWFQAAGALRKNT